MKAPPGHLQEFAERLRALVAPFGSISRAAKALEIPENTLRRACAGKNEPQAPLLMALSTKLDVSMSYLLGLTDEPDIAVSPGGKGAPRLEMIRVPDLDARVAAGPGGAASAIAIDRMLAFPAWMLHRLAPPGARLAFMRAQGDSMSPLFGDGALLLVNENDRRPPTAASDARAPGDVFVFRQEERLRVKRLRRKADGAGLVVMSENRAYAPEFLRGVELKRISVLGRVVWWDDRL
jgi:hypothetical protein